LNKILLVTVIASVINATTATANSETYTESIRPQFVPSGDPSYDRGFRMGYGAGALDFEDCMLYLGTKYAHQVASTWAVGVAVCRQWMISDPKPMMQQYVDDWFANTALRK
jgi:hypothetical protein